MAFLRVIIGPLRPPYIGSHRGGGYTGAILGDFFEVFFRSLSTRDGFLTLPNDDSAGSTPGTCVFSCLLTLLRLEEKCPFLCLYSALSLWRGLYIKAMLGVNFSRFFFLSFPLLSGWIPNPQGG